jgi:hypothetical protein
MFVWGCEIVTNDERPMTNDWLAVTGFRLREFLIFHF